MPPNLQTNTIPQCLQCLRNYAFGRTIDTKRSLGAIICTRGKKSSTVKGPEQTVRLLRNMKGVGRRGDFVPVMAGKMRNLWAPNRIAEYVTDAELRAFRLSQISVEDGQTDELDGSGPRAMLRSRKPAATEFRVESLSPTATRDLIQRLVPTELEFFRKSVPSKPAPPAPAPPIESKRYKNYGNELLAARAQVMKEQEEAATWLSKAQAIYGSVTTNDVYQAITDALASDSKGKQIVLSSNDIMFSEDSDRGVERGNKIRHIGAFPFEIKIPGDDVVIRRIAHIRDQDVQSKPSKDILEYL